MDVGDVVRRLLQVAGDVAGDEDGVVLVADEAQKFVQNLVPHHRVQAAGGLVQDEEPGAVGEGGGDGELHLHAPGELLDELLLRELEFFQVVRIEVVVPCGIDGAQDALQILGTQGVVEEALVQHHAHLQLGGALVGHVVLSQNGDGSAVPADQVQNTLDGGGLARPVLPNETHDGPPGDGQIHMVQGKVPVGLAQILDFQTVFHDSSP